MKKSVWMLLMVLMCMATVPAGADILINEIMSANGVFIDGENHDWIEIYNDGDKAVDLSGYGLSDSKKEPLKWQFPSGAVLAANDYAIVYCTGEAGYSNNIKRNEYYTDYKLSQSGENIVLSDAEGNQLGLVKYPQQYGNISYGIVTGGGYFFLENVTPGKKNDAKGYESQAERPVIETEAGFYTLEKGESLEVVIAGDGEIRYTLDGSEPNRSSKLYTKPIRITKTTVLRARVCNKDQVMSPGVGATFFINDPSPVAVVSLSIDEKYLYDDTMGVFVKGSGKVANYKKELEYPLHIEYFDTEGVRLIAQNGSFGIAGTSSRSYKQKSIAVFARDVYGDENRFNFNPFEHREYESYKSLVLRSTGSDNKYCRMRDVVFTAATEGLGLMYQDARPILVYINGEYWGHYNLREKVNKHSIAQWEGITDSDLVDQIDVLESSAKSEEQIQNGSNEDWLALQEYAKSHDLNNAEYLKYVTDRLDVENFFTWACVEMVIGNADMENVRIYRVPGGKWKYVLYDVEGGGSGKLDAVYMLLQSKKGMSVSTQYGLMKALLKVPEMKALFLNTLARVIRHSFLYETKIDPIIDKNVEVLEELLPRHLQRYNIFTMKEWRTNVGALRYAIRTSPKKTVKEVIEIMGLKPNEQEAYFGEVLELLDIQNAKDKQ